MRQGTPELPPGSDEREPARVWFAHAARGVAVVLVVWFHLGESFLLNASVIRRFALLPPVDDLPRPWYLPAAELARAAHINAGLLGVALFFLISGFVIPFSLDHGSLPQFALRRIFRLYPVYWLSLALLWGLLHWRSRELGISFPYTVGTLVGNALLVRGYLGQLSIDAANWTLAIEELFYVVAAILAARGLLARPVAVVAVAFGCTALNALEPRLAVKVPGNFIALVYGLAFNAAYLVLILIGLTLSHRFRRLWSSRCALAVGGTLAILFAVCVRTGPLQAIAGEVAVNCTLALAIFALAYAARNRIPQSWVLDRLAAISYPLYMFHGLVGYILLALLLPVVGSFGLALAATLAIVLSLAVIVHQLIERPMNAWGRRLSLRWGVRGGAGADDTDTHRAAPMPHDAPPLAKH